MSVSRAAHLAVPVTLRGLDVAPAQQTGPTALKPEGHAA